MSKVSQEPKATIFLTWKVENRTVVLPIYELDRWQGYNEFRYPKSLILSFNILSILIFTIKINKLMTKIKILILIC